MAKFKIGDEVKCIENQNSLISKGAGWKKDLIFKVKKVSESSVTGETICWGGSYENGVYEDYLIGVYTQLTIE